MGDVMSVRQAKDKIHSVAVGLQQLDRVVKHGLIAKENKEMLLKAIEMSTIGLSTVLTLLPDDVELDCLISDMDNIILVENEEEAEKITSQDIGLTPKLGENIH